jgi:NAD(P)-dependent dehydrogenase (short-subunit alcohol dehydrogenase family)
MPRYELAGKVVLLTGGDRGIGFATARVLSARGALVVITGHDPAAVESARAHMDSERVLGIEADVTDPSAMQAAAAAALERFGAIDVVVANAGIASRAATFQAMSSRNVERVLDVDLMGVCRTVEAALPQILRARGHVTIVSSVYAFVNGVGNIPYAMAKAAVEQFGRALRVELAPHGASAGVAYLGFIDTEMLHRALDLDPLATQMLTVFPSPFRKRIPPADAARAIVDGIERRRASVVLPRRWGPVSSLRGLLNPLSDTHLQRNERVRGLVRQLDSRSGEEQPTTS